MGHSMQACFFSTFAQSRIKGLAICCCAHVCVMQESLQCQYHSMEHIWPAEAALPGFKEVSPAPSLCCHLDVSTLLPMSQNSGVHVD